MTYCPKFFAVLFVGLTITASVVAATAAKAETFIGSNVDERVTVALQVSEAAAQNWLPDGWVVAAAGTGPFEGANLMVVFVDRLLQMNAEGELAGGGSFRAVALVVPAKRANTDERAPFVLRIYSAHDSVGPYKNSARADVQRDVTHQRANIGGGTGNETWRVGANSGGDLTLHVDYQREVPVPQAQEVRPHSAVDPSFFRIYRVNQLVDVVNSGPAGIDRAPSYKLSVSIPELAEIFDGTEQLVGISVIPSYARQTFLP